MYVYVKKNNADQYTANIYSSQNKHTNHTFCAGDHNLHSSSSRVIVLLSVTFDSYDGVHLSGTYFVMHNTKREMRSMVKPLPREFQLSICSLRLSTIPLISMTREPWTTCGRVVKFALTCWMSPSTSREKIASSLVCIHSELNTIFPVRCVQLNMFHKPSTQLLCSTLSDVIYSTSHRKRSPNIIHKHQNKQTNKQYPC